MEGLLSLLRGQVSVRFLILLILVPMLERAIYPSLNWCGIYVSILGKVILGMFLAAGSAGMGEYKFGADSKVVQVFWSNFLH